MALLRDKVFAGVAATALTVSSLAPNFALAQDSNVMGRTAQQPVSLPQQQVNVPTRNVRGVNDAFLHVLAADESKDTVVLIVYGNNRALYDRVKKAAADVTAEGFPVRGILVANGPEAVEIYADAQSIAFARNPNFNTEGYLAETRSEIRHAYTDIIIPRRQRVAQVPTVASTLE